jgi:hypothetical protein
VFADMDASLAARMAYALVDAAMHALLAAPARAKKRIKAEAVAAVERAFLASQP